MTIPTEADAPLLISVERSAELLGISRSKAYALCDEGAIASRYVGTRRMVLAQSVHDFANEAARTA